MSAIVESSPTSAGAAGIDPFTLSTMGDIGFISETIEEGEEEECEPEEEGVIQSPTEGAAASEEAEPKKEKNGFISETIEEGEEEECEPEEEGVIQSPTEGAAASEEAEPKKKKKKKSKSAKGLLKSGIKTVTRPGIFVAKKAQKGVETIVVNPTMAVGKAVGKTAIGKGVTKGVEAVVVNPTIAAGKTAKKGVNKITGKSSFSSKKKKSSIITDDPTQEETGDKSTKNTSTRKSSAGKKSKSSKSRGTGLSKLTKGLVGMDSVSKSEHEALKSKFTALEETNKKREARIDELDFEVASMEERLDEKDKELEALRAQLQSIGGLDISLEQSMSQTLDEKRAQKRLLEQKANILMTEGHDSGILREVDDSIGSTPSIKSMPQSMEIVSKTKEGELQKQKRTENSKVVHKMRNLSTRNTYHTPHKTVNVAASPLGVTDGYEPPTFPKTPEAVQLIHNALRKNLFFENMDQADFDRLTPSFENVLVKNGECIITQGEKADYFYIVAKGKVIYKVDGKLVGEAGKEQSFGELSLLYTSPRAASVIALSNPTEFFRIDQRAFRQILQNKAKQFEKQKLSLLKEVKAFQGVTDSDLYRLADCMVMRKFKADQVVIRKGDVGNCFYILRSGSMRVTDIGDGTSGDEGLILKPKDYFGERALITDEPRAANVVGEEEGTCFAIDRDTFEKVLGQFSKVIMRSHDREILGTIKNIKDSKFSDAMLETLASAIVDITFKAGANIQEKGVEQQGALLLIRDGSVKIEKDGSSKILEAGAYFGHDQISKYTPENFTPNYAAICETDCTCGFLSLMQFPKLSLDGSNRDGHISKTKIMRRRSTIRDSFKFRKLELDKMEKVQKLGEGQFGSVHLVQAQNIAGDNARDSYALKVQDLAELGGLQYKAVIEREQKVMEHMRHPFIVDLIHAEIVGTDAYMLMNCITCGELWSVVHTENESGEWDSGVPEDHAKFYALIIADALACMHNSKIVYRDLKPENVMIDKDGYPNIIDFGFAKFVEGKTYTFCGTPNYIAPEIVNNMGHSFGVDHWAFGILLYEMISGENPFHYEGMDHSALLETIANTEPYPMSKEISNEVKVLIDALLEKDPTRRIGNLVNKENDILEHKWFKDIDLKKLREKELKAPFLPPSMIEDQKEEE